MHWSRCLLILAVSWVFVAASPVRRGAKPAESPAPEAANTAAQPSPDAIPVKLPANIDGVTVAKGGQYLALHLGKLRQLAIFDVKESKVIKYLPMKSDDYVVAGAASKLFIGHKSLRLIERIDLAKLQPDLALPAPEGGIAHLAAGANADGPVMLLSEQSAKRLWLLDPVTLKAEDFPSHHWGGHGGGAWGPVTIHISFDGARTVANGGGWAGIEACSIVNGKIAQVESGGHADGETLISGNGQLVFLPGSGILQSDLASQVNGIEGTAIPGDNPDYSLAFRKDKKDATLTLFANTDPRPLVILRKFPELAGNSKLPIWQRVHLAPQFKSLVTVGRGGDELMVRKFDLAEQLNAGGIDYLFVDSNPVRTGQRGTKYTYPISVLSKRGGVKMELQGGLPGMTLSDDGKLNWAIPSDFADANPVVIISITDASGQAMFHTFTIELGPLAATPAVAKTPRSATPQPAAQGPTLIHLSEPFREFHAAAAGKMLVFYLPKARQLEVYDTATGRTLGAIKLGADSGHFACGLETLVVALPDQGILQTYSLKNFQRTNSAAIPQKRPLKDVRMGNASKGPLLLYFGGELVAMDPESLAPLKLRGSLPSGNPDWWFTYRPSADGTALVCWDPYSSPSDFTITRFNNGVVTTVHSNESFSMANRRFTPTADGSLVLYEMSFFNDAGRKVSGQISGYVNTLPASDPRFLIAVKPSNKGSSPVAICAVNDRRILAEIHGVGDVGNNGGFDAGRVGIVNDTPGGGEPRVVLLPDSKVIAAVLLSNDRFEIHKIDLDAAVAARSTGGETPLAVVSIPPREIAVNSTYSYQIQTVPQKVAMTYKVEDGPPGLTVSPQGHVTWKPTTRPIGSSVKVILSIKNPAGQEVPHAFDINVVRGTGGTDASTAAFGIVKADDRRIELPSADYFYTPGLKGRILLLSGNQLAILAPDGFTIEQSHVLPKSYKAIGERADYFVAICQEPRSINVLDKKTLKVTRTRDIAFNALNALVLHPTRPISYVSYRQPSEIISHQFLIFDESNAEARTDDNWAGEWLAIAPDGRFLMAGFQETYRKGNEIIDNPDRIWIVPTYGSYDCLARYDLDNAGFPTRVAYKEGAGGNGVGIRLSPDGKCATYLSHTGYPSMSANLGGWDPLDLGKLPTAYSVKNTGTTMEAAFHPLLPLVASPGKGTVAFFNRASGTPENDRIAADELAGEDIHRVYFSPDGKILLVETTTGPVHYLYHLPLKLSPEELKAVAALPRPDKPVQPPAAPAAPTKKQKLPVTKV